MTETRKITFAAAINEALTEEMAHDPSVILIGDNISAGGNYGVTANIADRFRINRVIDIPPAEATAVGFAVGLAMTGAKPVLEINGRYLLRAADMIINELAKTEYMYAGQFASSMVIRVVTGVDPAFNAQLNQSWESLFCGIEGLSVVYPSTAAEAKGLLKAGIRHDGPVIFFENLNYYDKAFSVPSEEYLVSLSKAEIKANGHDLTLIAYGPATRNAYEAAKLAASDSISCELIDLRTISPIDYAAIDASVSKTGRALIISENDSAFGVADEIAAHIASGVAFDYLDAPIVSVCADRFITGYGKANYKENIPGPERIYRAIKKLYDAEEE